MSVNYCLEYKVDLFRGTRYSRKNKLALNFLLVHRTFDEKYILVLIEILLVPGSWTSDFFFTPVQCNKNYPRK